MIIGHFAPALIPYHRLQHRVPIAWLLFCSVVNDLLFPILTLLGVESVTPSSPWSASVQNLSIDTTYSHGPFFSLAYAVLLGVVTYLWFRDRRAARWCAGLVILHFLIDLVWGYDHFLWGPNSPLISLGLFNRAPILALSSELIITTAIVAWYIRAEADLKRPLTRVRAVALLALFATGVAFWLTIATRPLGDWLAKLKSYTWNHPQHTQNVVAGVVKQENDHADT